MKLTTLILLLLFNTTKVLATAQTPDYLITGNDTLAIFSNPLEGGLGRRPEILNKMCSTSCWRSYVAYFRLKNDSLFVENVYSCCNRREALDLSLIFPNRDTTKQVFAKWVTQTLMSPSGELIDYRHMGYMSIYAKETDFKFEQGILKDIQIFNNTNIPNVFDTIDESTGYVQTYINWANLPELTESFRLTVEVKVDSLGKIIEKRVENSKSLIWDNEALRVVGLIDILPVIIQRGKIIKDTWTLYVWFNPKKRPK